MKTFSFIIILVSVLASCVVPSYAWKKQYRHKEPNLPGIIHEAPCKTIAPGVYDCGNHKNKARKHNKKTGRWRITYRPTEDITVTAQSKAYRDAKKKSD